MCGYNIIWMLIKVFCSSVCKIQFHVHVDSHFVVNVESACSWILNIRKTLFYIWQIIKHMLLFNAHKPSTKHGREEKKRFCLNCLWSQLLCVYSINILNKSNTKQIPNNRNPNKHWWKERKISNRFICINIGKHYIIFWVANILWKQNQKKGMLQFRTKDKIRNRRDTTGVASIQGKCSKTDDGGIKE